MKPLADRLKLKNSLLSMMRANGGEETYKEFFSSWDDEDLIEALDAWRMNHAHDDDTVKRLIAILEYEIDLRINATLLG